MLLQRSFEEGEGIELMLTDLMMPGITGAELAVCSRERFAGLPVVVMSGYGDRVERLDALDIEVLRKPFDLRQLLTALAKIRFGVASASSSRSATRSSV